VVIGGLNQRAGQLIGSECFAFLPSPEDFPRSLRQIHGIKKVITQVIFDKGLIDIFLPLSSGIFLFQFRSNS
jgi:hypothetical protein